MSATSSERNPGGMAMPRMPGRDGVFQFRCRWHSCIRNPASSLTAKPPRKKIFGVIPGPRPSDSYGYSQAKESTWDWYQRSTGNYGADRDDFGDAIDFIGWYNNVSNKELGISKQDAFRLYLAYHEGHGGYRKQSYRSKDWLIDVARKVDRQAQRYNSQLQECAEELEPRGWFDWW